MTQFRTRNLFLASVALGLFVLSGCGGGASSPKTLSGKVTLPSKVTLVETDSVNLIFIPEDKAAKSVTASVSPQSLSFTTKEIIPGKYKITLGIQAYPGMKDSEKRMEFFSNYQQKFAEPVSKLTYEVTKEPQQAITIDLDKETVTKN